MSTDSADVIEAARLFRDLVAEQNSPTTAREFMDSAEAALDRLTPEQVRIAAAFYFVRALKERHRDEVAAVERKATRPKRTPYVPTPEALERQAQITADLYRSLGAMTARFTDELRMEWDAELLASTFAMPDGTLVAWGEATVPQHETRRAMLLRNAQGNVEAAARHAAAIRDLTASRAARLDDLAIAA